MAGKFVLRALGFAAVCATAAPAAVYAIEAAHEAAIEALGVEENVATQMMAVLERIQKSPPNAESLFSLLFKSQDHPIDMALLSETLGVERLVSELLVPTRASTQWAADVETMAWNALQHADLTSEERQEALNLIEITKNAGFEMADILSEMMDIKEQLDADRRSKSKRLTQSEREGLKQRLRELHAKLLNIQGLQRKPTEKYFALRKRFSQEGKDALMRFDAVERITRYFKERILATFDPYL